MKRIKDNAERIILVGHGSPKKDANQMEAVGKLLHGRLHPGCEGRCVKVAYLQYDRPDLPDAIEEAVGEGALRIVIHPFFLSSGVHVTGDIPNLIKEAERKHPGVRFFYTKPLGLSEDIINAAIDRITTSAEIAPGNIEGESMKAISRREDLSGIPDYFRPIVQRVIHATADFEYKDTLMFHPDSVTAGLSAIKAGKNILTDVEMVKTGINKNALSAWGGKVICRIKEISHAKDKTRAEAAIEEALKEENIGIVAVGNAPTALLKCIEMVSSKEASPDLVVGVPVGFVRAEESKSLLAGQQFPYITNTGKKGGSAVAAAIINALLKMAIGEGGI